MTTIEQTLEAIKSVGFYINPSQLEAIGNGVRTSEGEFFKSKLVELADTVENMPVTYEQDGKGDEAVAYLHYFHGDFDWWITEKDMEGGIQQAFGLASMQCAELGYISILELTQNNIELDLHFKPTTLGEIKKALKEKGLYV